MLKYLLIVFLVLVTQTSCTPGQEEEGGFKPLTLDYESRQEFERLKREVLKLEDLKVGTGPVAAWGRKIRADVVARYVGSGTVAYQGPVLIYWVMAGSVFIHNSLREAGALDLDQIGIILGLNGMAVGGKRLITIPPKLVCAGDGSEKASPKSTCPLVFPNEKGVGGMAVSKEQLIVEATLTGACVPLYRGGRPTGKEDLCRDSPNPRLDPSTPIWRFY
ncbi:MAG: hypothetical protein IT389_01885 [Nitrospira sp.]|nr:hypothetical protein [Nitrospira sp.]